MIINLQLENEDLINYILSFAEKSEYNVFISLVILRNYLDELENLSDEYKNLLEETSFHFMEKSQILVNFVIHKIKIFHFNTEGKAILSIFSQGEFDGSKDIVEISLDFLISLNILKIQFIKNPELFDLLYKLYSPEYCGKISFIFSDQIKKFESAFTHITYYDKPIKEILDIVLNSQDDVNMIKSILFFFGDFLNKEINLEIFNGKNQINNNTKYSSIEQIEDMVSFSGNILCEIMTSFTVLLLTKNEMNDTLNNFLRMFLTCGNRRISSQIFPAISEICNMLKEVDFENLYQEDLIYFVSDSFNSLDLKNYFCNLLMEYMGIVMLQCKINEIYIPTLEKEIILDNCNEIQLQELYYFRKICFYE